MTNVQAAVKGILMKDGKFLIVKQKLSGFSVWDLPGGRIKYGSDPKSCLMREFKEETDLDVDVLKLVGNWYFFRENDGDQVVITTFLCEHVSGEIDMTKKCG